MRLVRGFGVSGLVIGVVLATGTALAQGNGTRGTASNSSGSDGSGSGGGPTPVGPYHPTTNGGNGTSSGGYSATQTTGGYGANQSGNGTGTSRTGVGPVSPSTLGDLGISDVPLNQRQLEDQQAKARNTERQKELIAETQKLVALANELQADVAKTTKDTLSLDVIRKADEIDKLARNVREKMKNAN